MDGRWVNWLWRRPEWLMLALGAFILIAVLVFGLAASGEEDDLPVGHTTGAGNIPANP